MDLDGDEFASGEAGIPWVKFPTAAACLEALSHSPRPCSVHNIDLSTTLLSIADLDRLSALVGKRGDIIIRKLRVAFNALDDEVAPNLLQLVEACSDSLEYLDLSFNHLTDAGVGFVASGCVTCPRLHSVYFTSNLLSDAAVKILVEACRHNRSIKVCDVADNPNISPKGARELQRALKGVYANASSTLGNIESIALAASESSDSTSSGGGGIPATSVLALGMHKKKKPKSKAPGDSHGDDTTDGTDNGDEGSVVDNDGEEEEDGDEDEDDDETPSDEEEDETEDPGELMSNVEIARSSDSNASASMPTDTAFRESKPGIKKQRSRKKSIKRGKKTPSDGSDRSLMTLDLFHVLTLKSFLKQKARQQRQQMAQQKRGLQRRFLAAARAFLSSTAMVADMHFRQKLLGRLGVQKSGTGTPMMCNCVLSAVGVAAVKVTYAATALFCIAWVPFSCALLIGEAAWYGSKPSETTLETVAYVLPVDAVMMAMFFLDIGFGFLKPYRDVEGELVRDPRRVAKRYLCRHFAADLVVSFPWPALAFAAIQLEALHWRWLYLAPVLLRPTKLLGDLNALEGTSRPVISCFVKLLVSRRDHRGHAKVMSQCAYLKHFFYIIMLLVVAAHLLACMWIYIALYVTHGSSHAAQNNNWMVEGGIRDTQINAIYTAAIYWAMTTLTTVGYGDISPTSTGERLLSTGALVVGIAINALFIGRMSVLLLEFTEATTRKRRHRQLVEKICGQYNFPSKLRNRIEQLTQMRFSGRFASTALDLRAFMHNMSPALRMEVMHHMHRKIFDIVPVLRFNSLSFQRSVAVRLKTSLFVERDYVALYGDPCDCINFLLSGSVGVVNKDGAITHSLETGSFFGEQGILATWTYILHHHQHHGRSHQSGSKAKRVRVPFGFSLCRETYTFSVRTLSPFCEAFFLEYKDALELFQLFPSFADSLRIAGKLRTATASATARINKSTHEAKLRMVRQSKASVSPAAALQQGTRPGSGRSKTVAGHVSFAKQLSNRNLDSDTKEEKTSNSSSKVHPLQTSGSPGVQDGSSSSTGATATSATSKRTPGMMQLSPPYSSATQTRNLKRAGTGPSSSSAFVPLAVMTDRIQSSSQQQQQHVSMAAATMQRGARAPKGRRMSAAVVASSEVLDEPVSNMQRPQTPPDGNEYWSSVVANPKFIEKYQSLMDRSRSIQGALYNPRPRDLAQVVVPWPVQRIVRHIAQHLHEYWSKMRMKQGWTWGFEHDDEAKKHPDLIPHECLSTSSKRYLLDAVNHVVKLLISRHGISIDASHVDSTKLQWEFGSLPTRRDIRLRKDHMHAVFHGRSLSIDSGRAAKTRRFGHHGSKAAWKSSNEGGDKSPTLEADDSETLDITEIAQSVYQEQLANVETMRRFSTVISQDQKKRTKHESMARNYLEKRALQAVVEDEVVGYMYTPQPFPLQNVELPSDVLNSATVVEPLAKASHDVWARSKMDNGWTFGPTYDSHRRMNNRLVPYRHLHSKEKKETRSTVIQVLKGMVWLGYRFSTDDSQQTPRADFDVGNSVEALTALSEDSDDSAGSEDDRSRQGRPTAVPQQRPKPTIHRDLTVDALGFQGMTGRESATATPESHIADKHRPAIPHMRSTLQHRTSSGGTQSLNKLRKKASSAADDTPAQDNSAQMLQTLQALASELAIIKTNQERLDNKLNEQLILQRKQSESELLVAKSTPLNSSENTGS